MGVSIAELSGVLPALCTPVREDGGLDEDGLRSLVRHTLAGGVQGLLALGSTGEVASLDESSRRRVVALVVEEAGSRVPVISGVAQDSVAGARAEVRAAAAAGCLAALVAPPHYAPIEQRAVLDFYRRVAEASPLPVLLYHIPGFTKVATEPETVATLAEEGALVGVKDSSRDFEWFERTLLATRGLPAFRAFTGSDTMLLASLAMGGCGTICGSANVAPAWVVELFQAVGRGEWSEARRLQDRLTSLVMLLRAGVFPAAIKAGLAVEGVCGPWPVPPVPRLPETEAAKLRERLSAWGLAAMAAGSPALP